MARASHLLGMNARNLLYIKKLNPKRLKNIVDSKLKTKKILKKNGLPVPKLIKIFRNIDDIETFDYSKLPNSFVIKPVHGFGGGGIMVVFGKRKSWWVLQDGQEVNIDDIKLHLYDILDGSFAIGNIPDTAYIEQKVKIHRAFKQYAFRGTPDIRIIVYNMVPVMAMLRLPTEESRGRANLHQGAIGVGVDIATGITIHGFYKNKEIKFLPHSKKKINGLKIPDWEEILRLSVETQKVLGLGYIGVDIVLDKDNGPLILEVNARPGLGIQAANKDALRRRLDRVEDLKVKTVEKGIRVGKELFGGEISQKIQEISGRPVVGTLVPVEITGANKKRKEYIAKVDTGAWRTTICRQIAEELGLDKKIITKQKVWSAMGAEERPIINLKFSIGKKKIFTKAFIADRVSLKTKMIIGRKDLHGFLIDPSKHLDLKRSLIENSDNRSV